MAQKIQAEEKHQVKAEQVLARKQRQELKDELTENFVKRARLPHTRRRVVTLSVLGAIALLAILFLALLLLPASPQQPHGGIAVGQAAPEFTLPVQGGTGTGKGPIDLRTLRGHPVVINFWSESCPPCLAEIPYLRGIYDQHGESEAYIILGE